VGRSGGQGGKLGPGRAGRRIGEERGGSMQPPAGGRPCNVRKRRIHNSSAARHERTTLCATGDGRRDPASPDDDGRPASSRPRQNLQVASIRRSFGECKRPSRRGRLEKGPSRQSPRGSKFWDPNARYRRAPASGPTAPTEKRNTGQTYRHRPECPLVQIV